MAAAEQDDSEKVKKIFPPVSSSSPPPAPEGPTLEQKPVVQCLIPAFSDACNLVDAPYSCLVVDTHRRHIALAPMYLSKKRTGIQDQLNTELLKYSESLKGVPLAYDNIKVVGEHGHIYDDQGYIHMNIEASFVIFQPKKGQKLVGVINKVGVNHVGCLVHGCFNASIPKPALMPLESWQGLGLSVGDSLEFEVFQLDADVAGVLLIRGSLGKNRVHSLLGAPQGEAAAEEDIVDGERDAEEVKVKKKKKKDRRKGEEAAEAVNGHDSESSGRKRRRKHREERTADEEPEQACPREERGDGDGRARRRREKSGGDEMTDGGFNPPSAKKKRRA
ncbi:DNA-directed RNA polymerase I subunit RPA43 [Lepisosteus oculatus]|uniref:DNA-directed RNA polymerase I subunit RPA43 n=1 Tax=Lepisosteus oculatus TaxID=7918 RepID=UPI0035F522DB